MTLPEKIMSIYPAVTYNDFVPPIGTILLQNDGDGDYIKSWTHPDYPRPTDEQLAEIE